MYCLKLLRFSHSEFVFDFFFLFMDPCYVVSVSVHRNRNQEAVLCVQNGIKTRLDLLKTYESNLT